MKMTDGRRMSIGSTSTTRAISVTGTGILRTHGITRIPNLEMDMEGNEIIPKPRSRNPCPKFWRFIYFHGSLIGPAPCSFICLCSCSRCCTQQCLGSMNKSSFATKLMYLVFLAFVMFFATLFIVIYSTVGKAEKLAPCMRSNGSMYQIGGWWGDCRGHAGYFICYRIFLAFVSVHLFLALCTIGVTTSKDFCRPGIHQGFWVCKFILFFSFTAVTIVLISVQSEKKVSFDESWMYIGLMATVVFSIPQLIFFLELVEQAVIKIKSIKRYNWRFVYWGLTSFFYLIDMGVLAILCSYYTYRTPYRYDPVLGDPVNYNSGKACAENIIIILYGFLVGVILTVAMVWQTLKNYQTYPNVGLLHSSLVFGHTLVIIYIAMGNSVDIECRLVWYPYVYNDFSQDVTFTVEGVVHVAFVFLTIVYFVLIVDHTSATAPLSKVFEWVCCKAAKKPRDEESLLQFTNSQFEVPEERRPFLLHNDEAQQLQYSWPCFHLFIILGSLSIMMGMTNFIRPIADGPNAASLPGFWCKFVMSPITALSFIVPIIYSWFTESRRPSNDSDIAASLEVNKNEYSDKADGDEAVIDDTIDEIFRSPDSQIISKNPSFDSTAKTSTSLPAMKRISSTTSKILIISKSIQKLF